MSKPYRMQRLGILNHQGEVWTPDTFDNVDAGQAYIARAQRQNPTWDLSNHTVAPVRITVTPVKKPGTSRRSVHTANVNDHGAPRPHGRGVFRGRGRTPFDAALTVLKRCASETKEYKTAP